MTDNKKYHVHISAKNNPFQLKLNEIAEYKHLIIMFTKKYFSVSYKQTVLGPAWLLINPVISALMKVLLFGNIAKLSTDGTPMLLFYFTGTVIWTFFSNCFTNNASTFNKNATLFGKVYFPRMTVPLSNIIAESIKFGIQFLIVLVMYIIFGINGAITVKPLYLLLIPFILLWLGIMGMGFGIIVSSATTKYKDLSVLVTFGITLWMYGTPIVYTMNSVKGVLNTLIHFNPVTAPVELFKFIVLGVGEINGFYIAYSLAVTVAVALMGILVFNKVERTFIDTV